MFIHHLANRVFQQDDPAEAILIPTFQGKRANPVLLEKRLFEALARLSGDAGARALFSQFPVKQVPFEEPDLAFDVDSPEASTQGCRACP